VSGRRSPEERREPRLRALVRDAHLRRFVGLTLHGRVTRLAHLEHVQDVVVLKQLEEAS
jgi:hypothetical protein